MKKGFALIETIITIVVLSTSLLYLYSSYNSIISDEKTRLYYDDVAYIYKTNYIKKFLQENAYLQPFKENYISTIGIESSDLFSQEDKVLSFSNIINNFNVSRMILINPSKIDTCNSDTSGECDTFNTQWENLSSNFKKYINTINGDDNYYLVVEYTEIYESDGIKKCTIGETKGCSVFYASIML